MNNSYEKTVSEAIAHRHSPFAFSGEEIPKEILEKLLTAAQWSASAFNEQPWRFILGIKGQGENHGKILSTLVEGNQVYAKDAPILLISVSKEDYTQFARPNAHATYDTGQAISALALQAAALDIHIHQMAGFSPEKAREEFQIPEGFRPMAAAALGYLGAKEYIHESLLARSNAPRRRKPLEEIIFTGTWGEGWK